MNELTVGQDVSVYDAEKRAWFNAVIKTIQPDRCRTPVPSIDLPCKPRTQVFVERLSDGLVILRYWGPDSQGRHFKFKEGNHES